PYFYRHRYEHFFLRLPPRTRRLYRHNITEHCAHDSRGYGVREVMLVVQDGDCIHLPQECFGRNTGSSPVEHISRDDVWLCRRVSDALFRCPGRNGCKANRVSSSMAGGGGNCSATFARTSASPWSRRWASSLRLTTSRV